MLIALISQYFPLILLGLLVGGLLFNSYVLVPWLKRGKLQRTLDDHLVQPSGEKQSEYPISNNSPRQPIRKALPIRKTNWLNENKWWFIIIGSVVLLSFGSALYSSTNWLHAEIKDLSCPGLLKQINMPHNDGWLENYAKGIMQNTYDGRCSK